MVQPQIGSGGNEGEAANAAAGIGVDGVSNYDSDYDQSTIAGLLFGQHQTGNILFVIPEAVASINTSNAVILLELQKHGHVDTIVQTDALNYPDFAQYNVVVLGSNISVAWTTSNLAHVKEYAESVLCVDEDAAVFLEMGAVGGDAAAKTSLVAITQIEANDLGIGHGTTVGLAAGANAVAASTIFNTIDMSDADITETFFGTENTADNTDVLLAAIFKRQPDGTRGILKDGFEATGTRWFYGCAYSAVDLNTLGLAVIELILHMAVQASTLASLEISGDIGDLETKLFGNQANEFNNGNPMVEFLTGRNSSGTKLPIGKSLYDQHLVPAKDGTDDVHMRDVVGKKEDDAATGAVSTTESLVAQVKQLITMQKRAKHTLNFKSTTIDPLITLNASAADEALPSVVVAGIPSGAVITRVEAWVSIGEFEDTSTAENSLVLAGTEHIQVKETAAGSFVDAIKLVAAQWLTGASLHRGGNIYFGAIDIKAEVDANDTYSFQIENADVTGASLLLRDVQCGLIVEYTLE